MRLNDTSLQGSASTIVTHFAPAKIEAARSHI
jgi:hypothetical protein